jgi:RNA polymerase sigma-70 factor (ECF subfamily)
VTSSEIPIGLCLPAADEDAASPDAASPLENEVITLFDLYRGRIFRYVLSFRLAASDSEDIVQEVFLSLFRHLQLDRSRSNLRGWIFRVAHNLALKRRMSNQKTGDSVAFDDEALTETFRDPNPDPEQNMAFQQRQARLLAVVRALPVDDERCLRLRAEGLKYREIAEVLGMSLGAVSIALTRSLARLERADGR